MKNVARDKNAKLRFLMIACAIGVFAFVVIGRSHLVAKGKVDAAIPELTEEQQMLVASPVEENPTIAELAASSSSSKAAAATLETFAPASTLERESLKSLAEILFNETRESSNPTDLLRRLQQIGYQPMISRDSNEYTGTMVVIRTKNTLPGTRYFHAQYFTDEAGAFFPQHISFEFRPSKNMNDVVKSLETSFGRLGTPVRDDGTWMTWKLPNDYTLWIKKLEKEDLMSDNYNAYSSADLNTIRVAIEKDVEGHEDEI